MTGGYNGLQWVTRADRGLQGVTVGHNGLQGVARGDGGLQGVTGGYKELKKLFLTRTFPDTFSWSVLHKNQS